MALANAIAGALYPGQTFTWLREEDGTPEDLTDANVTGILRPRATRVERPIVGELLVVDGPGGRVRWTYDIADVVGGFYDVRFQADRATGPTPGKTFWTVWYVEE